MFNVLIYDNIVRSNVLLANWTNYVSGLTFGTSAMGGYATCEFTLKKDFDSLLQIVEGTTGTPTYCTNRIRITAQESEVAGAVVWEGMIYNLELTYGNATISRSVDSLFNIARTDYTVATVPPKNKSSRYNDATSRATFGNKVFRQSLGGAFASADTTPTQLSRRYVTQHKNPGKSSAKGLGGASDELTLSVSCVGFASTLEWRDAFNNDATSNDTAQIVKDMIRAGSVADGGTGAGVGRNNWVEILTDSNNTIGFGAQHIAESFANVANSSVTVARNLIQGTSRLEIIKGVAAFGSSNYRRMLFQVWDDGTSNAGKGIPYFVEQPSARGGASGYTGYYDNTKTGTVFNANMARIPLYLVRAGQWMTSLDLPQSTYVTISTPFDDPRMFWIEETNYSTDTQTLTLTSSADFNIATYLGRLINGQRRITEQF